MIFEIKSFQPLNGVRDKVLDLIWLWIQSHLYHSDNKENCTTWCIDYCLKCCVNTSKVSFLGKGEARLGHISVTMIQLLNVCQMYSQICEFYSVFSAFLSSFDPSFVALYDHMSPLLISIMNAKWVTWVEIEQWMQILLQFELGCIFCWGRNSSAWKDWTVDTRCHTLVFLN